MNLKAKEIMTFVPGGKDYNEAMQTNFMMNLEVVDLDAWWRMIQETDLVGKYPGVRAVEPKDYPWGKREIHLIDPAGVLWHIAVRSAAY